MAVGITIALNNKSISRHSLTAVNTASRVGDRRVEFSGWRPHPVRSFIMRLTSAVWTVSCVAYALNPSPGCKRDVKVHTGTGNVNAVNAFVSKKMSTQHVHSRSTPSEATPQHAVNWTIPVQDVLGVINRTAYIVFPPEDDVTAHPPVNSLTRSRTSCKNSLAYSPWCIRVLPGSCL